MPVLVAAPKQSIVAEDTALELTSPLRTQCSSETRLLRRVFFLLFGPSLNSSVHWTHLQTLKAFSRS